ncbi:hypothetical protein BJX99DRAFT_155547 [Aspergillus californicus]
MSRCRPPNLHKWSYLNRRPSVLLTPLSGLPHHPIITSKPKNDQPRPFHTTPISNKAVPAPSTRARMPNANRTRARVPVFNDTIMGRRPERGLDEQLSLFRKTSSKVYTEMVLDHVLDNSIGRPVFEKVGAAILEKAYTTMPTAEEAVGIANDAGIDTDNLYEIGRVITRNDTILSQWVFTSFTRAGARMAVLLTAARYLQNCHRGEDILKTGRISQPVANTFITQIEELVLRPRTQFTSEGESELVMDFQAMIIYAKYLGLRGRYEEALKLMKHVMDNIQPSKTQQPPHKDLSISGYIEPPWTLYLWLTQSIQPGPRRGAEDYHRESRDDLKIEAIRNAAENFEDPSALFQYAGIMKKRGNWEEYEKCMGKAAAAGDVRACRKIANYYYLIFIGKHPNKTMYAKMEEDEPQLEERDLIADANVDPNTEASSPKEQSTGFFRKIKYYFGPRPAAEYRALAMEWYRTAAAHGDGGSAMQLGTLLLQDGNVDEALEIINKAEAESSEPGVRALAVAIKEAFKNGQATTIKESKLYL